MLRRLKILGTGVVLAGSFIFPVSTNAATSQPDLSNAEVIVKSSANPKISSMTNTDAKGHFVLNNIPAGGINVIIRRNNQIIVQGAAIFKGGSLDETQVQNFLEPPPSNTLKSGPGK